MKMHLNAKRAFQKTGCDKDRLEYSVIIFKYLQSVLDGIWIIMIFLDQAPLLLSFLANNTLIWLLQDMQIDVIEQLLRT